MFSDENALSVNAFLNRLKTLQKQCVTRRQGDPSALLVIPGLDGRNNKESVTLLKYLFGGIVGRELLNNSGIDDALEEMVLLIQETSVSVIYTSSAKKICGSMLSSCPFLIEYMPLLDEEEEIDLLQARKVSDFKRMMLECVPPGSTIGMSIPIGYDSVLDVESWPLLQSFALDSVICPTGFFTSRYTVADMSEMLSIIYRTVDEYSVDNAIAVLRKSILPHIMQTIAILDGPTGSQRALVVASDAIGPLEMLYEFGEMECMSLSEASGSGLGSGTIVSPLDPAHRPVLLFGSHSFAVGAVGGRYPKGWQDTTAGDSLHVVVEGCEPSTGIRFCRCYFLRRGKSLPYLKDADALVGGDDDEIDEENRLLEDEKMHRISPMKLSHSPAMMEKEGVAVATLERLEGLYVKLWLGLRATVQFAFQSHVDVLEAGTYVQRAMDALMKGKLENMEGIAAIAAMVDLPGLSGLRLRAGERLQVHMDCMNALGEVVSVEDVDDMGGSCWCYIRVSIHGIATGSVVEGGKDNGYAVAVGDTFLFSVGKKLIADQQNKSALAAVDGSTSTQGSSPSLLLADSTCLTHAVPYYRCLLGQGDEDKSAQRFLACTRSPHMLHALGLGDPIDLSSSGVNRGFNAGSIRSGGGSAALLSSVPTLTDHPILPVLASDIRLFSAGLVIERTHTASLPIIICMEQHVAEMWTVDASECLSLAQTMGLIRSNGDNDTLPEPSVPDGLLVILRLKQFDESNQPSVDMQRTLEASQAAAAAQEGKENRRSNYEEKNHDDDDEDDDDDDTYHRKRAQPLVDDITITSMRTALMFNPLKRALSNLCTDDQTGSQCIALFAPMGTRISAAISTALISWRAALRSQDIPEHRGQGVKRATTTSSATSITATGTSPNRGIESVEGAVPVGILRAFVTALDTWSIAPADTSGPGATWGLGGESRPVSTAQTSMDDLLYEENIPVSSATLLTAAKQSTQDGVPASGFLAMRSVHAYSEAIRLHLPNGGVQTYNATSTDEKQSGAENTVQLVIVTGQAGSGVGVLARHIRTRLEESSSSLGTVGSVTVDLAAATADVAEVLGEHDSDEAKANDDQKVSRACREAITTAFQERMKERNVPTVIVVSVTLASRFHTCQSDLLFLLHHAAITSSTSTKMSVSIAVRIAVVSATAAANAVLVTPCDGHLVGVETWRSTGLEICHRGVCDVAIVIDATSSTAGDAYYSFRNWLQRINPDAQVVRQHPGSLRLDEEAMDMLSSFLATNQVGAGNKHNLNSKGPGTGASTMLKEIRSARTQAHATFAIRYDPLGRGSAMSSSAGNNSTTATTSASLLPKARFSCRPSVPGEPAGLSAFRVIPPSLQQQSQSNNSHSKNNQSMGTGLWSIPALLHVMQFIFPQASVSCPAAYAAEDHWNVPPPTASVNGTPQYGFRRAIELARAKVFSTRRFAAEKQAVVNVLNEVRKQAIAVDTLRMGMLSVHGTLLVRSIAHTSSTGKDSSPSNMSKIWVTFEAHSGAIIVREASMVDENTNSTCPLIIQGSFTSASEAMLRRLVLVCEQRPLLRKIPVTRDSLSPQDITNAQIKYCGLNNQKLALPGGWWFDGNVYLDVNGNKRPYRPDIEDILVDYLIEKNKIVDQFNQHIRDLQPYL